MLLHYGLLKTVDQQTLPIFLVKLSEVKDWKRELERNMLENACDIVLEGKGVKHTFQVLWTYLAKNWRWALLKTFL